MILRWIRNGAFAAGLCLSAAPVSGEETEVVPFNAVWQWLMIFPGGPGMLVDPSAVDPDFLTTWTTPAYNGPEFQSGPAPLSYGGLTFLLNGNGPLGTDLPVPDAGSRGTVYFRTTFNLAGE